MRLSSLVPAFLGLASVARASDVFYASAVSYCSESRAIQVQQFLLEYDHSSNSVSFEISAESVEANLEATLSLEVEVYGINAINISLNLCDELGGVLCPLPQYNFVGGATIPIGLFTDSTINVPAIGYKIPDLEATAYVRLVRINGGTEAACLKVDLSNGESTRWRGVSWGTGGLALGMLLVGALGGLLNLSLAGPVERGRAKERLVSYMLFLQFITSSGMLSVDYPKLFTSFCANFAWAMGFIYVRQFQENFDSLRNHTGGNLSQLAGELNLVGGTEAVAEAAVFKRALALPAAGEPIALAPGFDLMKRAAASTVGMIEPVMRLANASAQADGVDATYAIPTVQNTDTANTVELGIPRFLVPQSISPYNGFLTTFVWFLILFALFLAVLLLLAIPIIVLHFRARKHAVPSNDTALHKGVLYSLTRANALRLLLICWYPLLVMAMYQWTIGSGDSYAPIVLSAFTVAFTTGLLLFLAVRTIILVRRLGSPAHALSPNKAGHTTPFWNMFKDSAWWMFFPLGVLTFARSLFLCFAQRHGWVQSVALTVIEVIALVLMIGWRPFTKKTSNGMNITIQILRCIVSGALIAFNPSLGLNEIIRVVIGAVLAVICSVVVIFFLILTLIDAAHLIIDLVRLLKARRQRKKETQYVRNTPGGGIEPGMMQETRMRSGDSVTLHEEKQHSNEKLLSPGGPDSPGGKRFSGLTDDTTAVGSSSTDFEGKKRASHAIV